MVELHARWLGFVDYLIGLRAHETDLLENGMRQTIFGMEHPLTITLGKRADPLKDIRASVMVLKSRSAQIVAVDRGGQATLHNPGQLVIYPHIHLPTWGLGVREYVHRLQEATLRLLVDYGVVATTVEREPGLYTERGKIAFFGLRIQNGWSSHGLALNVYNSLQDFDLIRACGQTDQKICAMAELTSITATLPELFEQWCGHFTAVLNVDGVQMSGLTDENRRPMVTDI